MRITSDRKIQLLTAVGLVVVGAGLLIAGFVVDPTGQIHNSVLIGFGEVMTFAGAIFGIDYSYKYKHTKIGVSKNQDHETETKQDI